MPLRKDIQGFKYTMYIYIAMHLRIKNGTPIYSYPEMSIRDFLKRI